MTNSPEDPQFGSQPGAADPDDPPTATMAEDPPPRSYATPPAPPGQPKSRRPLIFGAAALVLVVVAVVVVILLTSGSGSDDSSTSAAADFQEKVSLVMAPVIAANERLSRSLQALDDQDTASTQRLVKAAQDATLTARGGLTTLTVPEGSAQIATNLRGTLGREEDYLAAVMTALRNPASGSAEQTQTLQSNLTDALNTISPDGQDWAQSVNGADTLTAWAPRTVKHINAEKKAKAKAKAKARRRARQRAGSSGSSSSGSAAPAPAVGSGTPCGGGLYAGPNTSCPFAQNVQSAYYDAPGASATVQVYSPVTETTYTMSCSPAGSGVTCSGGNNASVSWST